ncbi:MAG: pyruvate kinase alpha/beta domain-containing protein [Thermodesulfovibrionales bacterium]
MSVEKKILYFEKPGRENTSECLEVVKKALKNEKYKHVVVASTSGYTGIMFSEELKNYGINLVVVTHSSGFKEPNTIEMPDEIRAKIIENGAKVFTGPMLTHSLETSLASKFGGSYPTLIIANTLRRFGEGAKVCCEIVMMATDAGLIPEGEDVIAVAGTATGADTVMVIKSSASKRFLDLKVIEILAKPRT